MSSRVRHRHVLATGLFACALLAGCSSSGGSGAGSGSPLEVAHVALASAGTPRSSMTPVGYGESHPLYPEVKADGTVDLEARALNRRVELVLLNKNVKVH